LIPQEAPHLHIATPLTCAGRDAVLCSDQPEARSKPDRVQSSEFTKYRKLRGVDFFGCNALHALRNALLNSCNANELCLRFFLTLSRNVTRVQKSLACRAGRKKMKGQGCTATGADCTTSAPRAHPRPWASSPDRCRVASPACNARRLARPGPPPCISSDELKNS
jgi:hypothetical protein